ncbi:MAG: flagellar hook-associated protein FlgL, partial [Myxococcales bacterium]|nr:flagellar hook-associated protein FlgL [Myxococcales bacterium]
RHEAMNGRVSDSSFYDHNLRSLIRERAKLAKAQLQASSGKRVLAPSDDPLAAALAMRERSKASQAVDRERAAEAGLHSTQAADAALADVAELLRRAQELAIQGATDTLGAPERAGIAREIEELREAALGLANTEIGGSHVFGGARDGSPPFDASGAYLGDANVRSVQVAPGILVEVSVAGDAAFGSGGTSDVLGALEQLRLALDADDVPTIRASIDSLNLAHSTISTARAELGSSMRSFESSISLTKRLEVEAIDRESKLVGVDPLEAFMDFTKAQTALEAAVRIASELPPVGLVGGR